MNNWREISAAARTAQQMMIADITSGEEEFERLLRYYPNDGMVYYQRGLGYEYHKEYEKAKSDLEKAEILFPKMEYQKLAREALNRINRKKK